MTQIAEKIADTFDQARDYTLRLAEELANERALNDNLEQRIATIEAERDRERRDRLKLLEEFKEMENRARMLERDNAVMHSRAEQIASIIKADGERIASNSHLTPEQIFKPRPAAEFQPDFNKLQEAISELRPEDHTGGYIKQIDRVSHTAERSGLAEAAASSTESDPRP